MQKKEEVEEREFPGLLLGSFALGTLLTYCQSYCARD